MNPSRPADLIKGVGQINVGLRGLPPYRYVVLVELYSPQTL
jgi:hypothetical protein